MRRVALSLAVACLIGSLSVHPSTAEPAKCGAADKLCRHLSALFIAELHGFGTVRRWEEDEAIFYTAIGLTPESDKIFGEVVEDLGKQAGLSMRRAVGAEQLRNVRVTVIAIEDPAVQSNYRRVAMFAGSDITIRQGATLADQAGANIEFRPRYGGTILSGPSDQGRIQRCAMYLRWGQMHAAERSAIIASEVYQCLTGFQKSDALVSVTNTKLPATRSDPPFLNPVDAAILRLLYEPGTGLYGVQHDALVSRLEARLRAEGFRDDGSKH